MLKPCAWLCSRIKNPPTTIAVAATLHCGLSSTNVTVRYSLECDGASHIVPSRVRRSRAVP